MSYETEANEIARQLRQKHVKENRFLGAVAKLEVAPGVEYLTTREAAAVLGLCSSTLRSWANKGGPIQPVHVSPTRWGWRPKDIENLLNGLI